MSTPSNSDKNRVVETLVRNTKAFLMKANKDGISVYDQLTRMMEVMLDGNANDILYDPSNFSEMFTLLQRQSFIRGESTATCNEPMAVPPAEINRLTENMVLFDRPQPEVTTTIEQPDPYTTVTTTTIKPLTAPNYGSVVQQNYYWKECGCGLAEEEAFLLERSITRLAMAKQLQDIRFVGKIFGFSGNYYIISTRRYVEEGETIYQEVNSMPKPPRKKIDVPVQDEPGFVGANRLSFWVTSSPSAEWVLLPDVTVAQINASRAMKKMFSGDLMADVVSSPPFPWKESVLLRAVLSRLVSGTFISPIGAMEEPEADEEEDDMEEEEDGPPKPKEAKYRALAVPSKEYEGVEDIAQLASLDQWVHSEGYIYKNGRQTKIPEKVEVEGEEEEEEEPQEQDEEEEEEEQEEEEEEEEEKELFTPITEDYLFTVIDIPLPPPPEDDDEEGEEEEEEEGAAQLEESPPQEEDNTPLKPLTDGDVPADDPTKLKVVAWVIRLLHNINKAHRLAVVRSLRWPGAIAYAADNGKTWRSVYFGTGLKKSDTGYVPTPAPTIVGECADLVEVMDPTAATEKLVRRGEDAPEPDSEDELEEEEDEDGQRAHTGRAGSLTGTLRLKKKKE